MLAAIVGMLACGHAWAAANVRSGASADALPIGDVHADFDGDGRLDVASAPQTTSGAVEVVLSGQRQPVEIRAAAPLRGLIATDIDRDGDVDLVALTRDGSLAIWINQGAGRLTLEQGRPLMPVPTVPADSLHGIRLSPVGVLVRTRIDHAWVAASMDPRVRVVSAEPLAGRPATAHPNAPLTSIVGRGPSLVPQRYS